MGRNGSGLYTRTNGTNSGSNMWMLDRDAGTKITVARHDAADQDIADALTASIAKDGQTTPTANLPMGGFALTNIGAATARTMAAQAAQIQDGALTWGGTSGGSANAQTIALSPAITAYARGQMFAFTAGFTNTTGATLNVNGVGAVTLKNLDTSGLVAGQIVANSTYVVVYDTVAGASFILLNPTVARKTWTPLVSGDNGVVTSSVVVLMAEYQILGNFVHFRVAVQFTIATAAPTTMFVTLPLTGVADGAGSRFGCAGQHNSVPVQLGYTIGTTNLSATLFAGGTWTLGTFGQIHIDGKYKI